MVQHKKGQAAMEFLMTYGWAILVVLVVIGALAYFGVLSPSTLLPEKCTFPVSVSCTDFGFDEAGTTTIRMMLQNSAGKDMVVWSVDAVSDALGGPGGSGLTNNQCISCVDNTAPFVCDDPVGFTLRNGASSEFRLNRWTPGGVDTCRHRNTGRDKNRYVLNISYSWVDSQTIRHSLNGELLARRN
ncbi:hypothetical protein HYU18_01665 [Candidatus Woesearchaeota archaeon]|nr:hypothetical protein [Candidatus Woesearchaeota archaeon]